MPTIDTITYDAANYLQAIARGVAGVRFAPTIDAYPTVLDTPNLPAVISWPSDAQWYVKGGAARQSVRAWLVLCYVEPLGQNDIPSNAALSVGMLDKLINAYTNVANLSPADPPPYQLTIESGPDMPHSDGGITPDLQFGGKPYYGIRLRVNVRAYWGTS